MLTGEDENLNLTQDDIHLWFAYDEEITDTGLINRYHDVLSSEESLRHNRFRFARHRHQFLVTRALVRSVLSFYQPDIAPRDWQFDKNEHGKPYVNTLTGNRLPIHFNLSHTEKLVVLAVGLGDAIGIDVEYNQRQSETLNIADRYFSPSEVEALFALKPESQNERFFHLWTLKEAYIKACGMGLAIPLDEFSFHFNRADKIAITFAPQRRDEPQHWRFWGIQPNHHHRTAVALKSSQKPANFELSMFRITPFAGYERLQYPFIFNSL